MLCTLQFEWVAQLLSLIFIGMGRRVKPFALKRWFTQGEKERALRDVLLLSG